MNFKHSQHEDAEQLESDEDEQDEEVQEEDEEEDTVSKQRLGDSVCFFSWGYSKGEK